MGLIGNGKIALKVRTLRFKGPSRVALGFETEVKPLKDSRWLPPGKLRSEMFLLASVDRVRTCFTPVLFFVLPSLSSYCQSTKRKTQKRVTLSWICSLAIPPETRHVRVFEMLFGIANNVLYQSVIPPGPEISTTSRRLLKSLLSFETAT